MNSSNETSSTTQAAAVAAQAAPVAPKKAAATRKPTAQKGAPKAKKAARAATKKTSTKKVCTAAVPREFSKKAIVINMLKAKTGATLDEIMQATGWQRHTCRGFLSIAGKTFSIESVKTDARRRYRIAK
jgi:hypothetical protein